MGYLLVWLVVAAIVLVFNFGAHMNDLDGE